MRNIILAIFSTICFFCTFAFAVEHEFGLIELGDLSSKNSWVYLCGLTSDFYSEHEIFQREKLDRVGKKVGIKFIAIKPSHRSERFNNALWWPHFTPAETLQTYHEIIQLLRSTEVSGYLGFSNGGFFLNQLAQRVSLGVPIISIGSAGIVANVIAYNTINLLIGTQDHNHFDYAKQFAENAKRTSLKVELIIFEGGHVIPEQLLEKQISKVSITKKKLKDSKKTQNQSEPLNRLRCQ